ncbi:SHOCT domain-containing protein [Halobellus salinisoli]|uniref:SHOCT domain-containing protein n=1 Tax=Halobellus salinisoli TaxID=3108500 RepID=UPI00300B33E6
MVRSERDGDDRRRWDEGFSESDDPVVGATALLVLGAGLGSLFGVPILNAVEFWVIFVIGYAVVVPLVSLLRGERPGADDRSDANRREQRDAGQTREADQTHETDQTREGREGVDVALDRLRERYARGDLSDEQFERKLERLLETDTPENAR